MSTDNPTYAELVEAVRIADAFIKAQASRLESQASRIEELEAENKRLHLYTALGGPRR